MTRRRARKVAVLGGGLTGLSAAFYLMREARERGEEIELTVLEGSGRLGGRVNTLRRDGFVIERGPDSFLARKLPMIRLAEDLGLTGELTGTNPAAKKTYISRDGKLLPMPEGLVLGVPTDAEKFMRTELVSEAGKLRALEDREYKPGTSDDDETVGAFLERHMGAEMVMRIFEPLLAGIYAGDLYGLSLQATFPQFKEMEREYGSLIEGTIAARAGASAASAQAVGGGFATSASSAAKQPASLFYTFRNGLSTVIEALEQQLRNGGCEIRLGAQVSALEKVASGAEEAGYRLRLEDGGTVLEADQVLLALPAGVMAKLLSSHVDVSALERIHYGSVANVVFGYDATSFGHDLDGSGFLVPRDEGRTITASTWTSAKWLHTAPEGKRLVRCYVGRAGDEAGVELSDEELTAAVRRDLRDLMGVNAAPEFVEITRLRNSMPQYPVGHTVAISAFGAELSRSLPGVFAAGVPFGGVGLPDCVAQGRSAAERMRNNT
ncbi:protoporphyrinogen oxidase [Cohnella panacarvi]|uniref:protoporphyrinogen oxidase n=1 Tax=Cohnella panacarvi TaxID=400776 RepID=UPI00047890FB|nr:protoporphyrinogen oxidase [Cohnella panacarvi]